MRRRSSSKTNPILYMGTFFKGQKKNIVTPINIAQHLQHYKKPTKEEKNIASTNQMLIYLKANQQSPVEKWKIKVC